MVGVGSDPLCFEELSTVVGHPHDGGREEHGVDVQGAEGDSLELCAELGTNARVEYQVAQETPDESLLSRMIVTPTWCHEHA